MASWQCFNRSRISNTRRGQKKIVARFPVKLQAAVHFRYFSFVPR